MRESEVKTAVPKIIRGTAARFNAAKVFYFPNGVFQPQTPIESNLKDLFGGFDLILSVR